MIRSDLEREITLKALRDLEQGFVGTVAAVVGNEIASAQVRALHSQIVELHEQLTEYNTRAALRPRLLKIRERLDTALAQLDK